MGAGEELLAHAMNFRLSPETYETFVTFSEFGLRYLQQGFNWFLPEGHALVKDWFLMKWWHVLLVSIAYPFILGNIRVYRFENHPKPILAFSTIGLFFTAFSVVVYNFILYEIFSYFGSEHFFVCHTVNSTSEKGNRIASVLWFFHVARFFFDLVNTIQSALTKSVVDLKSEQSINEIRFTLTHFLIWWLTLLYTPGGEGHLTHPYLHLTFITVLYPVATVCMFYLGTIACAFSQGKFIKLKMILWIVLVVTNFARLGANLWYGCAFPSALFTISPPYDINSNVHMIMFYFVSWIPAGFLFHYFLYGRGNMCSWWVLLIFLLTAHWPLSSSPQVEDKKENGEPPKALTKRERKEQKEKKRERDRERNKEEAQLLKLQDGPQTFRGILYRKCSYYLCNSFEKNFKSFKVCAKCRSPYCSRECQIKDWDSGNHKVYCKLKCAQHQNKNQIT